MHLRSCIGTFLVSVSVSLSLSLSSERAVSSRRERGERGFFIYIVEIVDERERGAGAGVIMLPQRVVPSAAVLGGRPLRVPNKAKKNKNKTKKKNKTNKTKTKKTKTAAREKTYGENSRPPFRLMVSPPAVFHRGSGGGGDSPLGALSPSHHRLNSSSPRVAAAYHANRYGSSGSSSSGGSSSGGSSSSSNTFNNNNNTSVCAPPQATSSFYASTGTSTSADVVLTPSALRSHGRRTAARSTQATSSCTNSITGSIPHKAVAKVRRLLHKTWKGWAASPASNLRVDATELLRLADGRVAKAKASSSLRSSSGSPLPPPPPRAAAASAGNTNGDACSFRTSDQKT